MTSLLEWAIKLMNNAAFIYLAACFFFVFSIASSQAKTSAFWSRLGGGLVLLGFALHTTALGMRWSIGGISRPPWTNLYESLVFFSWGIVLAQIYFQLKWSLRLSGLVAMPLVFILMGMSVMTPNKGVEPLIPALQSYWLKIHVVFGMLAYAGFTMAGCMAFLQLMRNGVSLSRIGGGLALVACLNLGVAGGSEVWQTGQFHMAKTKVQTMADGSQVTTKDSYRDYEGGPVITRMEPVPYANISYFASIGLFALAAFFSFRGRRASVSRLPLEPTVAEALKSGYDLQRGPVLLFAGATLAMAGLFGSIGWGLHLSPTLTLYSNPYLTILLFMTFFFNLVYLFAARRYEGFLSALPSAGRLDELSYVNILFAFPFQTLLLITGAIWAYYAWGRSWGWDPKETWALITWLAFLIYLHGKLLLRWKPNFLSLVAICGFVILVFAFLGVNLVLSGLHSYGSA